VTLDLNPRIANKQTNKNQTKQKIYTGKRNNAKKKAKVKKNDHFTFLSIFWTIILAVNM
jgi:hypothetical protein